MAAEAASTSRHQLAGSTSLLITLASVAASVGIAVTASAMTATVAADPAEFAEFLVLALVLQAFAVPAAGGGSVGVGGIGMIATGIALGPGAGLVVGVACGLAQWLRSRGLLHRAVFDCAQFALSTAAAAAAYAGVVALGDSDVGRVLGAVAAGLVYAAVNNALLCIAIGFDDGLDPREVWRERFRWARFHYLTFGALALAAVEAKHAIGLVGLAAFTLPPGLLLLSVRQYVDRTREALESERAAKDRYRMQSDDMRALFDLARGLAVRSHDRGAVVDYAQEQLAGLVHAVAAVIEPPHGQGLPLETGAKVVSRLRFVEGDRFDAERWDRLRPAVLPHLATAIESAELVERVWKQHLETIAALSRSMEAKDYYTGGHTERVAHIAVALARRLGFTGDELDAIEIGALLHDIGKIGIPERILNKPERLDEEEWKVMKEHPVISDNILSEVDLHPIVRQVARHSHERFDGAGYPDGLAAASIPLAARIVLVADALDALTTDRPYRRARHLLAALQEIREHAGSQFCPDVVAALEAVFREEPHVLGVGYLRAVEAQSA